MISTMTYGLPERDPHARAARRALAAPSMRAGGRAALALELADLADAITLPPFAAREVTFDWKANHTEVTALDRGAEAAIVERLAAARPHHRLLGEEHGTSGDPDSPWQWIVDPIDGTSGYVRGIPVWATLIALAHDGDGRRRRRVGAGAGPALVGVAGRRHVRRRRGRAGCRRSTASPTPRSASRSTTAGTSSG